MDFYILTMLKERLADDLDQIEELRCEAYRASSPVISDMPKGKNTLADGGKTACMANKISDMEEKILYDKIQLIQEIKWLEQKIANIPDSCVRVLITMHCIEGKSWDEIHKELNIQDSSDTLKHRCNRYLRKL